MRTLSFDHLVWATASCIAFFAALREESSSPMRNLIDPCPQDRLSVLYHLRTGSALRIVSSLQGQFVLIDVPVPKTRKDLASAPAMAVSPQSHFGFDPVRLLQA